MRCNQNLYVISSDGGIHGTTDNYPGLVRNNRAITADLQVIAHAYSVASNCNARPQHSHWASIAGSCRASGKTYARLSGRRYCARF